ncbi:serine hydrolase domain-containing protein [Maricaulis maris]|uniref:serine hydrolase domain-containing protein n=1 Tax=Maricaulis maris TaxID=74318 RepID=UPI003B8E7086
MAFKQALAAFALATTAILPVHAQDITISEDPAALGFQPAVLAALDARLDELAAEGARPGYAAIIARGEQIAFVSEAGQINLETGEAFTVDSPVRIASMTKPVTAVAIMMLVERGDISLDDAVSDYIPEFANVRVAVTPMAGADGHIATRAPSATMTIEHLLTHTAGIGYIFEGETDLGRLYLENSLYSGEGDLEARMQQLSQLPLYTDPGQRWIYSYSLDVAGRVVEVASGMPFEDFLETELFTPLAMHSTGFFFDDVDFDEDAMSPLYVHTETGEMVAFEQGNPDWASGGGGLVSTASDYIRFAMMLANGGRLGEVQILAPETFTDFARPHATADQLGDGWNGRSFALGMDIILPPEDGQDPLGVPGDLSWGGLFDTDFFVSPQTRTAAVIMTQIQPSEHRPEPRTLRVFRPMVYGSFAQQ